MSLDSFFDHIDALNAKIALLEGDKEADKVHIDALTVQLAELQAEKLEDGHHIDALNTKIALLKGDREADGVHVDALAAQVAEMQVEKAEDAHCIDYLAAQNARLEGDKEADGLHIDALGMQNLELEKTVDSQYEDLRQLQGEVNWKDAAVSQLKGFLREQTAALNDQSEQLDTLNKEAGRASGVIEAQSKELARLENLVGANIGLAEKLRKRIIGWEGDHSGLVRQVEDLQDLVWMRDLEIAALEDKLEKLAGSGLDGEGWEVLEEEATSGTD